MPQSYVEIHAWYLQPMGSKTGKSLCNKRVATSRLSHDLNLITCPVCRARQRERNAWRELCRQYAAGHISSDRLAELTSDLANRRGLYADIPKPSAPHPAGSTPH